MRLTLLFPPHMLMNVDSFTCPLAGHLHSSLLWAAAGLNIAVCMMPCDQQYHTPAGLPVSFFLSPCGVVTCLIFVAAFAVWYPALAVVIFVLYRVSATMNASLKLWYVCSAAGRRSNRSMSVVNSPVCLTAASPFMSRVLSEMGSLSAANCWIFR